MKLYIFTLFTILFLSFVSFGQTEKPTLNSWRGLILDESTFDDAKTKLGEPTKDKSNEYFTPLVYNKWFGNKPQKIYRKVSFKNIEGFDKIFLYFLENKLVVIEFDLKKDLSASALTDAYESKFYPFVGNYANGITPNDLADGTREIIYPERFPLAYQMGAANEKAIGLAFVSSGFAENFAAGMMRAPGGRTTAVSSSLGGIVRQMQLISRKLENTKGTDLLK